MIRYLVILLALVLGVVWVGEWVLEHPGTATITWDSGDTLNVAEMKTATLVFGVVAFAAAFYLFVALLKRILGLRKILQRMREARLGNKASRALSSGLIQLTEGSWEKAEKLLTDSALHSETPLLHYLGAARAAHMQEAFERRDEWLKRAIESDSKANVAVGVSQADMQMSSGQLEQASATLLRLRDLAPKHPYVLKLLAKVLYRQENWDVLLDILPELIKQNLLKGEELAKVQNATLQAMFQQCVKAKQLDRLQALWKKLPSAVREDQEALTLYARALHAAGDELNCANLVGTALNKQWHDGLAEVFGNIRHHSLGNAIQQAEKWQASQANNPVAQLLLARLYNQQKLWGMAKSYYESSLNQAPNARAYLELAELLETMKEPENAQRCYRLGLRYCIRGEGEKLVLAATQRPQVNPQAQPPLTPYNGL